MSKLPRNAAFVLWEIVGCDDRARRHALVEEFNLLREDEEAQNWQAGQLDIIETLLEILKAHDHPLFEPEFAMNSIRRLVDELQSKADPRERMKNARQHIKREKSDTQLSAEQLARAEWAADSLLSTNRVVEIIRKDLKSPPSNRTIWEWINWLKPSTSSP